MSGLSETIGKPSTRQPGQHGMGPPRPPDADCDSVPDDDDLCPQTQGEVPNGGCPADTEIVVVTGVNPGVLCPGESVAAHRTHCSGFYYWHNSYTTLSYDSRTH